MITNTLDPSSAAPVVCRIGLPFSDARLHQRSGVDHTQWRA